MTKKKPTTKQNPETAATDDAISKDAASAAICRSLGIPPGVWEQRMRQAERLGEKNPKIAAAHGELLKQVQKVGDPDDTPSLQAKPIAGEKYRQLYRLIQKQTNPPKNNQAD